MVESARFQMPMSTSPPPKKSTLLPFEGARRFARSLKLPTRNAWRLWVADPQHRAILDVRRVPSRPDIAYESRGWVDWTDWLRATGRTIASRRFTPKHYLALSEWLEWVASRGFRTKQDYDAWCSANRAERKRLRVPSSPAVVYEQFPGWLVALGKVGKTSFKGRAAKRYAPFREAKALARTLPLQPRTATGWRAWARDHRALLGSYRIPSAPQLVAEYRQAWRGWRDFLGIDRRPTIIRRR